jgi:hypothetical protein
MKKGQAKYQDVLLWMADGRWLNGWQSRNKDYVIPNQKGFIVGVTNPVEMKSHEFFYSRVVFCEIHIALHQSLYHVLYW